MRISVEKRIWPFAKPFKIARGTMTHIELIDVSLELEGHVGRGEGIGIPYKGETAEQMIEQVTAVASAVKAGASRDDLVALLPNGGARNALDCAMWDLSCKKEGRRIWEYLNLVPRPLTTVATISVDDPEVMSASAAQAPSTHLKIKVNSKDPIAQVEAVRSSRPDATLIVDANQSIPPSELKSVAEAYAKLDVKLLEQPLEAGADDVLQEYSLPIPICADESCETLADLERVSKLYSYVNIKLDKAGGLTHALQIAKEARIRNLGLMVGCMAGTSLGMAPSFIVGQMCQYVDIDGPLLMAGDREHAMMYSNGRVSPPNSQLWG